MMCCPAIQRLLQPEFQEAWIVLEMMEDLDDVDMMVVYHVMQYTGVRSHGGFH